MKERIRSVFQDRIMQRTSNIKQQFGFAQARNCPSNIVNHTDANGIVSKKLRKELFVSCLLYTSYDKEGKLIAKTALKQSKYAEKVWTKKAKA